MRETGATQATVASAIGISRSYFAEILAGVKKPGRETIAKIDRATGGRVPASAWFDKAPESRSGADA